MSKIKQIVDLLKVDNDYTKKTQLASYLLNVLKNAPKNAVFDKSDLTELVAFVFDDIEKLIDLLPKTSTYKEVDDLSIYADRLMGLITVAIANDCKPTGSELSRVQQLSDMIDSFRVVENAIDEMFNTDDVYRNGSIEIADITRVLDVVKSISDEYQKGKLYQGLLYYNQKADKLTNEAKATLSDYFCSEFDRCINKANSLTANEINNLEIAVDVCKYYINDKIIERLKKILEIKHNNIRFYAIATLVKNKESINADIIAEMAADSIYAGMTYEVLKIHKLESLFPKEYATAEYLAKCDLVHWLTYPTELGKVPDKIELLGDVKVKKEVFYVFKFMSNSDTLDDESKNVWLIGWSSSEGGTFSNFDKLSLFEQKNTAKTLKLIKKKLLG